MVVLLHRRQLAKILLGLNRLAGKGGGGRGGNSSGTRITATSLQQQILMLLLMLVMLLVSDDSPRFRLFHLFRRISGRAAALIGRVRHIGGEVLAQAVPHVLRSAGGGGGDLAVFGAAVLL